jgi:hypothetical protein
MVVDEKTQVLANDEHMEELLVHDFAAGDKSAGFGVADFEEEFADAGRGQIERVLDRIGNAKDQGHATAGAFVPGVAERTSASMGQR